MAPLRVMQGTFLIKGDAPLKCDILKQQINPIALRKAKIAYNFGLSECSRVKLL